MNNDPHNHFTAPCSDEQGSIASQPQGNSNPGALVAPAHVESTVATLRDVREQLGHTEWLWKDWLPLRYTTLLGGTTKMGKSAIAMYLAGVACGAIPDWPDGTPGPQTPGFVIWCESEGRLAVNLARAQGFGVPDDRIILPLKLGQHLVPFQLDNLAHMESLRTMARKYRPRLIVLDALAPSHSLKENDAGVARILAGLSAIAQEIACCILILHHTRKAQQGGSWELNIDAFRGSSAIPAAAVSLIGVDAPDPDASVRRLQSIACNLGGEPDPIGFRWDKSGPHSRLVFCEPPSKATRPTRMSDIRTAMLALLPPGRWIAASELLDKLESAGHNRRTAKEVARQLEEEGAIQRQFAGGPPPVPMWRAVQREA